ncbi:MAG: DUF4157 domain-containing protein [Kineosporiaceae bacterium]|nr:DUF4157 domain-containing protein [Kineosporiaceae bacterium]
MARGAAGQRVRERESDAEARAPAHRQPTRRPASAQRESPARGERAVTEAGVDARHDVGRVAVRPAVPGPRPMRAEAVSAPTDVAEQNAETIAHEVVRTMPPSAVGTAEPSGGPFPQGVPPAVNRVLGAPWGGTPLPPSVRSRIEPHLGVDLAGARVLSGPNAAVAAASVQARAFTAGSTIVLGQGESAHDTRLMAHEAAHVAMFADLGALAAHRATIHRDLLDGITLPSLPSISVDDLVPAWVQDQIRDLVRSIPGYTMLTQVIGVDPLTSAPVRTDWQAVLDELLAYGPFGAAVGAVLNTLNAFDSVVTEVTDSLARYGLTLSRITADVDGAWSRLSLAGGVEGNFAILQGVVDGILADVRRFVTDLADRIIAIVRDAVVDLVEPLLTGDGALGPVWSLATKIFHHDPLRGVDVEASTVDILADFMHLVGEDAALEQMRERGTLETTAAWLDEQLATFLQLLEQATMLFADAWEAIQPENLASLPETLPGLVQRELGLVAGIGAFAGSVLAKVLALVKNSLLGMLSEHAYDIPGFRMISVIIGYNPFTLEPVLLTPETLIAGFITLLPGGEAIYQELSSSGVIPDAAARISSAMTELGITAELITATFIGLWDTLSLEDLLDPFAAFERVVALFGDPLARILRFVTVVIGVVVELVLRLMGFPVELLQHVISETMSAIEDIRNDPIGFLQNLVLALKQGFMSFFDGIGGYLVEGLVGWLFHGLGKLGVTIPQDLSLPSILQLVLDVLGLSAEFLWRKLGEHLGEEKVAQIREALDTLGGVWDFIRDVEERGLVAIWERVQDQLSTLWTTILEMATTWILETLIVQGTIKLLTFLDPTFIMSIVNGCIAFYQGVRATIEWINEILQIIDTVVSTIASIARGDVTPGAQLIERGLAEAVPVGIGFLAALIGIGNVPNKIAEIILSIRGVVEAAIDWLIEQALKLGRAALDAVTGVTTDDSPIAPAAEQTVTSDADANRIPEGLPPEAIKQQALRLVEQLLISRDFETPKEVATTVAAILEANRSSGLHDLGVSVPDEESMDLEISASASAPDTGMIPFTTVFSVGPAPDPDQFEEQGRATVAAISVDGRMLGTVSRSRGADPPDHAEWILVDGPMWQEAIDAIVQAPPGAPVGQVALAINRTPCSFCADHVAEALAIVVRDLRAANIVAPVFVLAATGTYEPLIDASQEEIDADRALYTAWAHARGLTTKAEVDRYLERRVLVTRLDRLAATKWEDLEDLVVAGWDIRALQVAPKLKPFGQILADASRKLAAEFRPA